MEPAQSETGDCRVEPPASILVARLSMSHLVPLLEFNRSGVVIGGYYAAYGFAATSAADRLRAAASFNIRAGPHY